MFYNNGKRIYFFKWEERKLCLFDDNDDNNSNIIMYTFKYIVIKKVIKEKWIEYKKMDGYFYWSWKLELGGRERTSSRSESTFDMFCVNASIC